MAQDGWAESAPDELLVIGPNGQFIKIFFDPISGPIIELQPPNRAGWTYTQGHLLVTDDANKPWIQLESPGVANDPGGYHNNRKSAIYLYGESSFQSQQVLIVSDRFVCLIPTRITFTTPQVEITGGFLSVADRVLAGPSLRDLGRGRHTGASSAANSAAIPNGFTTALTTPVVDWPPNRSFRCVNGGRYVASLAGLAPDTSIRSNIGTVLAQHGKVSCPTTGAHPCGNGGQDVFVTGATTLTRSVEQIISSDTAGQTVTVQGPRWLDVFDIGPASEHPNSVVLT